MMIDVNVESEKMKWVVSLSISSIQERNMNEKNIHLQNVIPSQDLNHHRHNANAALNTMSPDSSVRQYLMQNDIISILTLIGCIISFKYGEYDDFNHERNVFDNAFKLECELEYDFDCDVLSSPTVDTINTTAPAFNFCATGVASREFDILGFDLCAASSPTTIAATQGIKNENEMLHESGSLCGDAHTQTQHPTAPAIDTINRAAMVVYLIIWMELNITRGMFIFFAFFCIFSMLF